MENKESKLPQNQTMYVTVKNDTDTEMVLWEYRVTEGNENDRPKDRLKPGEETTCHVGSTESSSCSCEFGYSTVDPEYVPNLEAKVFMRGLNVHAEATKGFTAKVEQHVDETPWDFDFKVKITLSQD